MPRLAPDGPFVRTEGDVVVLQGTIVDGVADGEWVARRPDGAEKARGRFARGRPEGQWLTYWPDGTLQERGSYTAGEAEGRWELYWPNGVLFESLELKAGAPHGEWRMHFESGALADRMRFEDGVQVGVETDYAPDGSKLAEGAFVAGSPSGPWTCWDDGTARSIPAPRSGDVTPREACGHPALRELEPE